MLSKKEIYEICKQVDSFIADSLVESIMYDVSYETLEAHHGILPISRRSFYRRRRTAKQMIHECETQNADNRSDNL